LDYQLIHPHIDEALLALKYLQQCGKHRHQVRQPEGFDFNAVVQEVLVVKNNFLDLQDQLEFLQERIAGVTLWGGMGIFYG
jgi:hypothetical protein